MPAVGFVLAAIVLSSCGRDLDDSGRGGPAVEPVAFIESADGPIWLGAPPTLATVGEEVLADVSRSVLGVRAYGCGPVSRGSAFAIAPGLAVGAAHVIAGATSIEIEYPQEADGELAVVAATVVGYDPARDLALLSSNTAVPPLRIDRVRLGISGAVLGYSHDGGLNVSPARIEHLVSASGLWGEGTARNVYLVAAQILTGQSGGPLVDRDGSAVGVAFASVRGPSDIGFALSRGELLGFVISAGLQARVNYLGDTLITAPPERLSQVPHGQCSAG